MFSPFSNKLQFEPIDPLGDGLGDAIAQEQRRPEVVAFQKDLDGESLADFWSKVSRDIHQEPN